MVISCVHSFSTLVCLSLLIPMGKESMVLNSEDWNYVTIDAFVTLDTTIAIFRKQILRKCTLLGTVWVSADILNDAK